MPRLYPWRKWLDSGHFVAVRGTHFKCSVTSFCSMLRQRAVGRDIGLHIEVHDGAIVEVTVLGRKPESNADLFAEV